MQRTLKVKVKVLWGAQEEIPESTATPEWFGDGRVSGKQPEYMCMITRGRSYTEIAHSSHKTLAKIDDKWKLWSVCHGPIQRGRSVHVCTTKLVIVWRNHWISKWRGWRLNELSWKIQVKMMKVGRSHKVGHGVMVWENTALLVAAYCRNSRTGEI